MSSAKGKYLWVVMSIWQTWKGMLSERKKQNKTNKKILCQQKRQETMCSLLATYL